MAMATCEHGVSTAYGSERTSGRLVTGLGDILAMVARWAERSAQRRHLLELEDYLLRDMGVTRADVEHEASKPFWVD